MSATFKLAKQKTSQSDLRKLMNEQKPKSVPGAATASKKIDSPLAKYNDLGQLTCILCKTVVRSEDVWKVHTNAKLHKQNIELAKQLKQKTNNFTAVPAAKRAATEKTAILSEPPIKKIKSILKTTSAYAPPNTSASTATAIPKETIETTNKNEIPSDFFDKPTSSTGNVPVNYFEATMKKTSIRQDLVNINRESLKPPSAAESAANAGAEGMEVDVVAGDEALPEGFFDDPVKDAKARNLEYKDPVEEEWDRFQKEIKAAADFSNAIMAEDQEEATAERQIDEIDEQMRNWSRVLSMEKRREMVAELTSKHRSEKQNTVQDMDQSAIDSGESSADEDMDGQRGFDECLDWRAKQSRPKANKTI